jgi:hypothetical protein
MPFQFWSLWPEGWPVLVARKLSFYPELVCPRRLRCAYVSAQLPGLSVSAGCYFAINSREHLTMPGPAVPFGPALRSHASDGNCACENVIYRWLTSQQARARVLLKDFRIADVASQRLDGPVA